MQTSSTYVLVATMLVIVIVIIYGMYIMDLSAKNIFTGSGKPISMSKIVISSLQMTAQTLVGILVVGIICVMILEGKVTSDAGLPIVSGIVGYLLGKSFKDVYDSPPRSVRRRRRPNAN